MQMLCMRSRLQPNAGSQRIPRTTQQLESEQKTVATMCVSIWELPTRLSTRYQVHNQRSTCCCPTHEMWELPTPLTVTNSPSREMSDRSYPSASTTPWHAQSTNIRHGYKRSEDNMENMRVCSATNATDNKTMYTTSHNSNHEHISMPNLKAGPSNTDLPPAKPSEATTQDRNTEKQQLGATNSTSAHPTLLSQQKALNKAQANPYSFMQASQRGINRSALARGIQRYHSRSRRSYLPSAIEEDKIHRQLKLSQLVSRSYLNLASDKSLRQNSDHLNQTTPQRATVATGHVTRYSRLNN
ncbi:peroxidase 1 [Dorcoceras hygrometricum]|uniref:Peroxidase 1 n=1 Tax=Dorcoceras hygrometricum TaxID=472368 RepID=A0A2Z7BPP9_9LAMI|nr:peroxidase 1 [Dorcoceras hygrometricum]